MQCHISKTKLGNDNIYEYQEVQALVCTQLLENAYLSSIEDKPMLIKK